MERGYTFITEKTVVFEWKITNVISYLKEGNKPIELESSKFSTGSKAGDKWNLTLIFNYKSTIKNPRGDISIFLENLSMYSFTPKVKFFILNAKHDEALTQNLEQKIMGKDNWGCPRFLKKRKLLNNMAKFIPNDTLTVCAEVTVNDEATTIPIQTLYNLSKSQLANDLGKLYESKDNSDVTIIVRDTKFLAHKLILSVRSPVLTAMFTHDMMEKKSNEISITDIDPEIFEIVLKYMYTDQISDLDIVAAGVLEAADKYQLQALKEICEEELMKSLNRENIINTVVLADCHNALNLKNYIGKCIIADASEIIKTEDFKELESSKPSLALELLKKVAIENSNKSTVTQTI